MSVAVLCGKNGESGLLGMDLYFANLVEDVTYYSNYEYFTYAFVINLSGKRLVFWSHFVFAMLLVFSGVAVAHPSYPRPIASKEQPKFVDILYLEKATNFDVLREKLLTIAEGKYSLNNGNATVSIGLQQICFVFDGFVLLQKRYIWKRVRDWYVVCIVVNENSTIPNRPVNWYPNARGTQLIHHRLLDKLYFTPAPNLCRHLNHIATLGTKTLVIRKTCFDH